MRLKRKSESDIEIHLDIRNALEPLDWARKENIRGEC